MSITKRGIRTGCLVLVLPWLISAALVVFGIIARPERFLDWLLLIIIGPLIALLIVIVLNAFVRLRHLQAKSRPPSQYYSRPPSIPTASRPKPDPTVSQSESPQIDPQQSQLPQPIPAFQSDSSTNLQGATERNSANRLRVDAAVPDRVVVMRPFVLAVAVRRSSSPVLREDSLTNTRSGTANVRWPILRKGVQIRLEVSAPDCQIVGNASAQFLLRKGEDSPVFYFQLIPGRAGDIGIVIKVFQQEEWLGSARVHTSAHETEIGKVELSIASVSVLSESETRSSRHSAYYVPTHVEVELGELQKKYGVLTRRIQAIDTDISRATSTLDRQVLEEQRSDYYRERRAVANEMSRLESLTGRQLADFPEPAEADDERDD